MSEHLLTNIEIKDFKCFKDFKAEGFKRVNLIGGKNNVGKTAFMEACYIYTYQLNSNNNSSMALSDIIFGRYMQDVFDDCIAEKGINYLFNRINAQSAIYNKYIINNLDKIYKKDAFLESRDNTNVSFIFNQKQSNAQLEEMYAPIIELKKEVEFDNIISEFDENIESFRIIKSEPKCRSKEDGKFYNLNEFGDGLHKYITYILALYTCSKGCLFIDEIENGIHWTQLDKIWELILTISKEQNVQVFATTHSKECIESYARVSKKLEDEDISFIELGRDENKIEVVTYNYKNIIEQVEQHQDIRGW